MNGSNDETVNQGVDLDEQVTTVSGQDHSEESRLFSVAPVWFSVGFYAVLFAWAAYLLYETLSFTAFEDYAIPYLLLPIVLLLTLLKMFTLLFPEKADRLRPGTQRSTTEAIKSQVESQSSENSTRTKAEQEKYELIMLAWVITLPVMMYVVGMGWSIILYVLGFTWYFTRDVKLAVFTTVGVTAFITFLFLYILDMIIWTGVLGLQDPLVHLDGQLEILLYRLFGI